MKWKTFWQIALLIIIIGAIFYPTFSRRPSSAEISKRKTTEPRDLLAKPSPSFIPDNTPGQADQNNHAKKEVNKPTRWSKIAESDIYKNADENKKFAIQNKYMDTVIKTDPRYKPEDELRIRKALFGSENLFANKAFGEALKYIQDKQFKEAIRDLDKLIEVYPEQSNGYYFRAMAFWLDGQYGKAISDCDVIIKYGEKPSSEVFLLRGNVYSENNDYENAIKDYEAAMKIDPKKDEARKGIASAYSSLGVNHYMAYLKAKGSEDIKEAIDCYSKAIEIVPTSDRYSYRGSCYSWKGDYDSALKDFDSALNLDANNAAAFAGKADIYEKKGEPQKAIYNYKKAIELNPKEANYNYSLGELYLKIDNIDSAIYYSTKAIDIGGDISQFAYHTRGVAYLFKKAHRQAYANLNMAKSLGADVDNDLLTKVGKNIEIETEIVNLQDRRAELEHQGRQTEIVEQYMSNVRAMQAQQAQQNYYRESLDLQRQALRNQQTNQSGSYGNPIHVKVEEY